MIYMLYAGTYTHSAKKIDGIGFKVNHIWLKSSTSSDLDCNIIVVFNALLKNPVLSIQFIWRT